MNYQVISCPILCGAQYPYLASCDIVYFTGSSYV